MSNKEVEDFVKKIDEGVSMAHTEMLRDKASRGESIVYSDREGNIKRALAADVLVGKVSG